MSRKWLLFLFCLSVLIVLAPRSRAARTLRVNESTIRISLENHKVEVFLTVENSLGDVVNPQLQIELLDAENQIRATASRVESIEPGARKLQFVLPLDVAKLPEKDRRQLLWYRLHYRLTTGQPSDLITEGFVSLSQVTPDIFEIRVAASEMAREAMRYQARVQAVHPITKKPAPGVRVDAVLTLETDDEGNGIKLPAAGVTDSRGYSLLFFDLPKQFPTFPHELRTAGGSIKVSAQRAGVIAEAEKEVLIDQLPRMLLTTDKPLYQPGQQLHIRVLALSPTRKALSDHDVIFRIEDPEDTIVFRDQAKSSRFGVANVDWAIPENARLGDYLIKVSLGTGDDSGQAAIRVRISRYDLPNFSVKVQPDRSYYLADQNAEVKVSGAYLFGQPVSRGHVRVVREEEREWNYREQKWDIEEGDEYKGETDATGVFTARINLADEHDLEDDEYHRFKDITYVAYFTDPTTNRTEQKRFDLRLTKDPIHVYIIKDQDYYHPSPKLPITFYVSTFYADGAPAACRLDVHRKSEDPGESKRLLSLRTNRYGLAKVSALRLPRAWLDSEVELEMIAQDSHGRRGLRKEDFRFDEDENEVRVETDRSLYRPGEAIVASITSSVENLTAIVDVGRDAMVLSSQTVRLSGGRASITIPYQKEFKDQLTIAAYADFPKTSRMVGTRTVLYPRNRDLKIDAQPEAVSYRPGDEASIKFRVRTPESNAASALGLAIVDKAVDERFRTDREFGRGSYGSYGSITELLGSSDQISGVTLRDLEHFDMSKPVAADLELLAEVLLKQYGSYRPGFFGGDYYEAEPQTIFGGLAKSQLAKVTTALAVRYVVTSQYPDNELRLRTLLTDEGVDLSSIRDPWGNAYLPFFSTDKQSTVLSFRSSGADEQMNTDDDLFIESNRWDYFRPVGKAIDHAVRNYHDRTGRYLHDLNALRSEMAEDGINLDTLRDRWNQPYRITFEIDQVSYVINVSSGGPDQRFQPDQRYYGDDFVIWTSRIDYFAERRTRIDEILSQQLESQNRFPQNQQQLIDTLRPTDQSFESLVDAWGHSYYATFVSRPFFINPVQLESRVTFNPALTQQTQVIPLTATAATITLRSMGPDGKMGNADDFEVAKFARILSEPAKADVNPRTAISSVVLFQSNGVIVGVVTDPNGAVVPAVKITITRQADSQSYSTLTNDDGKYIVANLPPGVYDVQFEIRGFMKATVLSVTVSTSSIVEVNVSLQVGAAAETVTVMGAAESVQTTSSATVSHSVTTRQFSQSKRGSLPVTKSGSSQTFSTPRLREYFPETLLWQPSLETDQQGRAQLKFKLADNITTWKLSVIASTEDGQIGTVEKDIKSFQPFFVEHDPPRILTEGDEISLPVVVRNYLDRAQKVNLEIKPEPWFALLGPATKTLNVAAGDAQRGTFDFRANASVKDGKQRITAIASESNDAIEKPITVHPDGEEKSITASDIFSDKAGLTLEIPVNTIPNSARAELKIYPNLLSHLTESVEAIMQRPYGCGEQTISSTYPSLLWLKQYRRIGAPAAESDLHVRAERYLRAGYARLLNYRDEDGGFTYWGSGEPDLALSAYALKFLIDARELIAVDDAVIDAARDWIVKQQRADGSWAAHNYGNQIETQRRSANLTAYVTRVLASTKPKVEPSRANESSETKADESTPALKRAFEYLAQRVEEIDEPYLIALYALAAFAGDEQLRARKATARLRALAREDNGGNYWSLETNTPFYGWGLAGRVETTALVVQALARERSQVAGWTENDRLIDRGTLFLLRSKDRYGVWYSTQATINVLDAVLGLLSRDHDDANTSRSTEIAVNGQPVRTIEMPATNRLVSPITIALSQYVRSGTNLIELRRPRGSSPASVQAVATYYLPWRESVATRETNSRANSSSGLRLVTKFSKTEGRISDEITCHVEAERTGVNGYGMMLAEIGLPPGADVDRASLEKAKGSDWSISQYDILPDRVIVYLWPRTGGAKFDFSFRPRFGLNAQTAASSVYDYYNPEARAVVAPARFVVK